MGRVADLESVAREVAAARQRGARVALANGAFDLLHVGHVRYLRAARELADLLVVAVNSDDSVRRYKGAGRPIVPAAERAELIAALEGVDWVLIFDEDTVAQVISVLKPELHVKGTDYTPAGIPEGEVVRSYGGQVVIAGDPKNHSSSALLELVRRGRP